MCDLNSGASHIVVLSQYSRQREVHKLRAPVSYVVRDFKAVEVLHNLINFRSGCQRSIHTARDTFGITQRRTTITLTRSVRVNSQKCCLQ